MKAKLFALFVALLMVGCGESSTPSDPVDPVESPKAIDLDDKETRDKIIAEAIEGDTLQDKGPRYVAYSRELDQLLRYAPNKQKPYTGWAKAIHNNGQIKELVQFKDGKKDGLRTFWYKNGQKEEEGNYKDGNANGLATGWYENGQKKLEINYKDGKEDGLWTVWHENGQKKKEEGNWKDGKQDGLWTEWYENGQKKSEDNYKDGKLWTAVQWKPNGEKSPYTVVNGNGITVHYKEDGSFVWYDRNTYKDGKRVSND